MNWNQGLSLRAECKDCGDPGDLSCSWDLFLVNATERSREEGAGACRLVSSLKLCPHCSVNRCPALSCRGEVPGQPGAVWGLTPSAEAFY